MEKQPPEKPRPTDRLRQLYTILLPGIPVAADRGALGWSTVVLVEVGDKRVLFDTGSFGDRGLLLQRLQEMAIDPNELDAVFISHLHYDHCLNMDLFAEVPVLVSERELRYVLDGEYRERRDPYVPAATILHFKNRLRAIQADSEIFPGVQVVALPGHTPGQAGLFLDQEKILVAGDGVKNGWEFINQAPPPSFYSQDAALKNYDWVRTHATEILPGHDRPFRLEADGSIAYLHEAVPVTLTLYPDPGQDPKTISIP